MSPQNLKKNLTNWDLVSVNPNDKNWDWKVLFCFWGVNIQSVIGFSLITSLYIIYNINTFVVFFGTIRISFGGFAMFEKFIIVIDGIGDMTETIQEKFGKKVKIKNFDKPESWLKRRLSSNLSNDIINISYELESRYLWNKYGL